MLKIYILLFASTILFSNTFKLGHTVQYFTFSKSKFNAKRYVEAIPKSLRQKTHLCKEGSYIVAFYGSASSYNELSNELKKVRNFGFNQAFLTRRTKCQEYAKIVKKIKNRRSVKLDYTVQYFTFSRNKFSDKRYVQAIPKRLIQQTHLCKEGKYIVAFYGSASSYQELEDALKKVHDTGFKQAFLTKRTKCQEYKVYKKITITKKVTPKPVLNEPVLLKGYQIPRYGQKKEANNYGTLNFHNYLDTLFEYNENAQEIFYQKKIDYLLNAIKKDKYGFDIFLNAYARTGSYISAQQTNLPTTQTGNSVESSVGTSINANKVLYDGEYALINKNYDILNKRLADIKVLNSKEKLLLFGVNIYSNLFTSQEKLKLFKQMYDKQDEMQKSIEKAYNLGATSTLNYIDSKNDLRDLKKAVLLLKYAHLHNEYILRHSIKAKKEKKYKLMPQKIAFYYNSLSDLQKQAIQNSSDIALESNKLKMNQTDFLAQKRRYYPSVTFNSHLGYGASNDALFFKNFNNTGFSSYWELGLNVNIPLYNRGDIVLNKEKELHSILLQKNVLSLKTREVLIEVERSYHSLQMIREQQDILQEQVALLRKKIKITTKLYHAGAIQYRDYSDAVKNYLAYKSQEIDLNQRYIKETFLLATLIGKRELYGEN